MPQVSSDQNWEHSPLPSGRQMHRQVRLVQSTDQLIGGKREPWLLLCLLILFVARYFLGGLGGCWSSSCYWMWFARQLDVSSRFLMPSWSLPQHASSFLLDCVRLLGVHLLLRAISRPLLPPLLLFWNQQDFFLAKPEQALHRHGFFRHPVPYWPT